MPRLAGHFSSVVLRLWTRLNDFIDAQAERQVNGWGSALQYKRRYTNPDTAKLYRRIR